MSTPYSDIYKKASILFTDRELLQNLTDDEYEEYLTLFLSKAKSLYFKKCKKDLSDVDTIQKQFNIDLDEEEQWILATGIKLVWVQSKLYREEKLRNTLGNKDYTDYSPANILSKLILLNDKTTKELEDLVISYTFNSFEGFK